MISSPHFRPLLGALATCFVFAGNLRAGTTANTTPGGSTVYAREVGAPNTVYTLPAGASVDRSMNAARSSGSNFVVDAILSGGSAWTPPGRTAGDLTLANAGAGGVTITLLSSGADAATASWLVTVTGSFTDLPTFTLATAGMPVTDINNVLGQGNAIQLTVQTRDAATGISFDQGADTTEFISGAYAVTVSRTLLATTATIDVSTNRTTFVSDGIDTKTADNGASLGINPTFPGARNASGAPYSLLLFDSINLTVSGDLSSIFTIAWNPGLGVVVRPIGAADVLAGTATLSIAGTDPTLAGDLPRYIQINVNGSTMTPRTLTVAVSLSLSGGASGPKTNSRALASPATLTIWKLNGSVLTANFMNGNTAAFSSRVYLWNGSSTGTVVARVYTVSVGTANPTILLGTVTLGDLQANSSLVIRLAEDILAPLGVLLPYTTNGGNLVLEISIPSLSVTGVANVFSGSLSYGVTDLNRLQ